MTVPDAGLPHLPLVLQVLAEELDRDPATIAPDAPLIDLGADWLDYEMALVVIDHRAGIDVPPDLVPELGDATPATLASAIATAFQRAASEAWPEQGDA